MQTFDNPEDLIRRVSTAPEEIIAVEGFTGVGKSTLAKAISTATGRAYADIDTFRPEGADAYVAELSLSDLAATIHSARPAVVSGICLRHAFEQAGVSAPTLYVYVKECRHGFWNHEDQADGVTGLALRFDERFPPSTVTHETRAYHEKWRPHWNADVIYLRDTAPDWARPAK